MKILLFQFVILLLVIITSSGIAQNGKPVALTGNALQFDGKDDYINCGKNIDLSGQSFTLELWAKTDTLLYYKTQTFINQKFDNSTSKGLFFGIFGYAIRFSFNDNELESELNTITDINWHHWAASFDMATGEMAIFKDGNKIKSKITKNILSGSGLLVIGRNASETKDFFKGQADEIRIWMKASGQDDLQNNMFQPLKGTENKLVAYWRCDEPSGILKDASAFKNDGTTLNMKPDRIPSGLSTQLMTKKNSAISFFAGYDPENDKIIFEVLEIPVNGDVSFDQDSKKVTYTPTHNFVGREQIKYQISDGSQIDTASVSIFVQNTGPVAGSGKGIELGYDNLVLASYPFDLNKTDLSIEFWAKRNTVNSKQVIFSAGTGVEDYDQFMFGFDEFNRPFLSFYPEVVVAEEEFTDLNWHNYAFVYNRPDINKKPAAKGLLTIYRDGNMIGKARELDLDALCKINTNSGPLLMGASFNASSQTLVQDFFKGGVDELRLWGEARTLDQINEDMFNPLTGKEKNLIVSLHMSDFDMVNDPQYTFTPDVSVNGHHFAIINFQDYMMGKILKRAPTQMNTQLYQNRTLMQNAAIKINSGYCIDNQINNLEITKTPVNGTVKVNLLDNTFLYTPNKDFKGNDSFSYKISDGINSDTTTIILKVKEGVETEAIISEFLSTGFKVTFTKEITALNSNHIFIDNNVVIKNISTTDNKIYNITTIPLTDTLNNILFNKEGFNIRVSGKTKLLQSPLIIADLSDNNILNELELTFPDNEGWRKGVNEIRINDKTLAKENYSINAGKITLKTGVFTQADNFEVSIISPLYTTEYLDQEVKEITAPVIRADDIENDIFHDIELTFVDNEAWRKNVSEIRIDSMLINPDNYKLEAGKLIIANRAISDIGEHKISIISPGFSQYSVIQNITNGTAWNNKIVSLTPFDNSLQIEITISFVITFENPVILNDGYFIICKYDGTEIEKIPAKSKQIEGNASKTITVKPAKELDKPKSYYMKVERNVFGSGFPGILSPYDWNFTTGTYLEEIHYSEEVGDKFKVDISYPKSYDPARSKKYPVVYFTDGQWRTDMHNRVATMANSGDIPEVIVVTIGYPNGYNYDLIRARDLTYGAQNFFKYLNISLIPYIDNNYKTDISNRTMAGHSFGGIFSLYCLFQYIDMQDLPFKNYLAASPSLWWPGQNQTFFEYEGELASYTTSLPFNLYMTMGEKEDPNSMIGPYNYMMNTMVNRNYKDFNFEYRLVPGADHGGTVDPSMKEGLIMLLNQPKPYIFIDVVPQVKTTDKAFELAVASPKGGIYSGPGVKNNMFDPAAAGVGFQELTYTVTDIHNVTNSRKFKIRVLPGENTGLVSTPTKPTFKIYPNPNNGDFKLELENKFNEDLNIELMDVVGKIVFKDKVLANEPFVSKHILITNYPDGIYLLKVKGQKFERIEKIIKR